MGDYRQFVGRRMVVQLPDITLAGTLDREGKTTLTMEDVTAVAADGQERPVDGTVVVERAAVTWSQAI
jgi:hypothetical protein